MRKSAPRAARGTTDQSGRAIGVVEQNRSGDGEPYQGYLVENVSVEEMGPDIGGDHRHEHDDDHGNVFERDTQIGRTVP